MTVTALKFQLEKQFRVFGVSESWLRGSSSSVQESYSVLLNSPLRRTLEAPVLPLDLQSVHGLSLFHDREVLLEVMDVHDIGVSTYSLLERLLDTQVAEKRRILAVAEDPTQTSDEPAFGQSRSITDCSNAQQFCASLQHSKATLSLRVSDGWTSAKALERTSIPGLHLALAVGTKVGVFF